MIRSRASLAACCAVAGVAVVVAAAGAQAPDTAPLLPNLRQERPSRLQVRAVRAPGGTRFRLGFRSGVRNVGAGPLVIQASRADRSTAAMTAAQVVETGAGESVARPAIGTVRYVAWRGHRHWHLMDFERYELVRPDGTLAAPSAKRGFCLGDRYDAALLEAMPGKPRRPPFTRYCGLRMPQLLSVREGISVGYGDEYPAQLEGQWIDVTHLPAGDYELVHRVNADGRLAESDATDNVACLRVRLAWPRGPRRAPAITSDTKASCRSITTKEGQ